MAVSAAIYDALTGQLIYSTPLDAEWGTYTYDVVVEKLDPWDNVVDHFAYKWPYCLTVGDHNVWIDLDGSNEILKCNYIFDDFCADNDLPNYETPSKMHGDIIDPSLDYRGYVNLADNTGVFNENDNVYSFSSPSTESNTGLWRIIFNGNDNCWVNFRRDHKSSRILASNQTNYSKTWNVLLFAARNEIQGPENTDLFINECCYYQKYYYYHTMNSNVVNLIVNDHRISNFDQLKTDIEKTHNIIGIVVDAHGLKD